MPQYITCFKPDGVTLKPFVCIFKANNCLRGDSAIFISTWNIVSLGVYSYHMSFITLALLQTVCVRNKYITHGSVKHVKSLVITQRVKKADNVMPHQTILYHWRQMFFLWRPEPPPPRRPNTNESFHYRVYPKRENKATIAVHNTNVQTFAQFPCVLLYIY
jgi:hypothetical protein